MSIGADYMLKGNELSLLFSYGGETETWTISDYKSKKSIVLTDKKGNQTTFLYDQDWQSPFDDE